MTEVQQNSNQLQLQNEENIESNLNSNPNNDTNNSMNNNNDNNNMNNDDLDLNDSHSPEEEHKKPEEKPRDRSAIKFIQGLIQNSNKEFSEDNARRLFNFYNITSSNTSTDAKLEPKDVRIFLFDLLEAMESPLVVPDEALDAVLHELCLNDRGSISWVEWKSFFVFLQDKPLHKIYQIVTNIVDRSQVLNARFLQLIPQPHPKDNNNNNNNNNSNSKSNDNINSNRPSVSILDKSDIKNAITNILPEAQKIYLFYTANNVLLALVTGTFETVLLEPIKKGLFINDLMFDTTIDNFDIENDSFPPMLRTSKFSSKVARTLATGIVGVKSWDEKNLKLRERTSKFTKQASRKIKEFDDKYKVGEKVSETTKNISSSLKEFDEKHKITETVSNTTKSIDEKLKISETFTNVSQKVKSNEKFQLFSKKLSGFFTSTTQTFNDITNETSQIVNEKSYEQIQKETMQNNNNQQNENINTNNTNDNNNNHTTEGELMEDDFDEPGTNNSNINNNNNNINNDMNNNNNNNNNNNMVQDVQLEPSSNVNGQELPSNQEEDLLNIN